MIMMIVAIMIMIMTMILVKIVIVFHSDFIKTPYGGKLFFNT